MKLKKYIKLTALLGVVSIAMFSTGCSTQKANGLDGTVLKDAEGNYYVVKKNLGDTVFLISVDFDSLPQKF